jgi:putative transposase
MARPPAVRIGSAIPSNPRQRSVGRAASPPRGHTVLRENGYCESFNGKLGDELLKIEIFYTPLEAQVLVERWRRDYNTNRPHSALGYRPPAPVTIVPGTADRAFAIDGLRPDRPFTNSESRLT